MKTFEELEVEIGCAIQQQPILKGSKIKVSVVPGQILLTGSVDFYAKKALVCQAVKALHFQLTIVDHIVVMPEVFEPISDLLLLDLIRLALEKNLGLLSHDVTSTCQDGIVDLIGHVKWAYQKDLATECIGSIKGIREINNTISSSPLSEEIILKKKILSAIKLMHCEGCVVNVDIQDNTITLTGTVISLHQIKDVEQVVRSIIGSGTVRNQLQSKSF